MIDYWHFVGKSHGYDPSNRGASKKIKMTGKWTTIFLFKGRENGHGVQTEIATATQRKDVEASHFVPRKSEH